MGAIVGIGCKPATVEGAPCAQTTRYGSDCTHNHRSAHAIARSSYSAICVCRRLLIQPTYHRPSVGEMRLGIQVAGHRQYDLSRFRLTKARALTDYR